MRSRGPYNATANMLGRLCLAALLALAAASEDARSAKRHHHHHDPFALLDRHMSLAMSHLPGYAGHMTPHLTSSYFWPWTDLAQAAAALGEEEALEDSSTVKDDTNKYEVRLHVRRFKPEELTVKVKNRAMLIEGKRYVTNPKTNKRFVGNHFVQQFTLPAGVESDEVAAVLKPNGVLVVSAPRHPVPPPKSERLVPIIVEVAPQKPTEKPEEPSKDTGETSIESDDKNVEPKPSDVSDSEDQPSDQKRLRQELNKESSEGDSKEGGEEDSGAAAGKIRKKALQNGPRKNETKKKSEMNELDYAVDVNAE